MRVAAFVYLLSAIAVFGYGVALLFTVGIGVGSLVFVVAVGAFLLLARGLFAGNAGACRGAIATSSLVSVGCFLVPLYLYVQNGLAALSGLWQVIGPFLAIAIGHALALAFLFRARPSAP